MSYILTRARHDANINYMSVVIYSSAISSTSDEADSLKYRVLRVVMS